MMGEVINVDPLLGYIVWLTNVVELYQKMKCNCFRCNSADHLVKDCLKEIGKTTRKVSLNLKEGTMKKGSQSSQKSVAMQEATLGDVPAHKNISESSLPGPRPTHTLEWT